MKTTKKPTSIYPAFGGQLFNHHFIRRLGLITGFPFALAAMLLLADATMPAVAGTNTWQGNGGSSNSWSDGGNWSSGVPANGDDVVLHQTGPFAPSNFNINLTANSLTLQTSTNATTLANGYVINNAGSFTFGLQSGGFITDNAQNALADQINTGITLNGPATITLSTGATGLKFGANAITGTGPLTLINNSSNDALQINVASSYTGATTINGTGRVVLGVNGAVPTGSALTVNGSALFSTSSTIGSLAGAGNVFMTGTNTLTVGEDNTDTTFSGSYQNSGGNAALAKTGTGTLTLSGSNAYAGGTTINAGTLQVTSDTALGGTSGGVTLNGGALAVNSLTDVTTARTITLNAAGGIIEATGTMNLTLTGSISGSGPLNLNDNSGQIFLEGTTNNTFTGLTTIDGAVGVVYLNAPGHIALSGDVLVNSEAALAINTNEQIADNATVTVNGLFALNGTSDVTETIGTLLGNGEIFNNKASLGTLIVGAGDFSGTIIDGTGQFALTKTGTGTLIVSGANSYTGGTTINGGILEVTSDAALGGASGGVTLNGGELAVNSPTDVTTSRTITLNAGGGIIAATGTMNLTLTGSISGSGPLNLNDNSGQIFLEGTTNNTFTGLTTIDGAVGVVYLNAPGHIALSGDVLVNSEAALAINTDEQIADNATVTDNGIIGFNGASNVTETIGTLLGSGQLFNNKANLGTLIVGAGDFSGTIVDGAGQFALTKTGTGTLTLSGTNTYTGGTTINAGTLAVGNSSALGTGVVTNSGTLTTATGNRLINLGGNYIQGPNGTLLLNLTSSTAFDSVNLANNSGVATLNGALALKLGGSFAPGQGQSFTVVSTNNPISGTFATAKTNLPSIGATVTYTDDVTTVLYQKPFVNLAGTNFTPNQTAVATYIDAHDQTIPNPAFGNLVGALNNFSGNPQSLASAFNELTPLSFGNFASTTAFNNTSFSIQRFDNYLANHRALDGTFISSDGNIDYSGLAINDPNIDGGLQSVRSRLLAWSPAPSLGLLSDMGDPVLGGIDMKDAKIVSSSEPANLWNVFVAGNVVLAQDFSNPSTGLPGGNSTTGAAQVGIDFKITPHLRVGALFGYGHTHATLDTIGSNASVNTYSPGLYASYSDSGWYINALGSYGFADYSQNRNVSIGAFNGTATSSPGGGQIVGDLDGGYDFHAGNWTFGPTLGLQYVHLDVDGYTETGLPGADLTVNENQSDSLRSLLGGRVSYTVKSGSLLFVPHLSAGWQHEFLDQSRGITSQFNGLGAGSFTVNTPNPSRDSALVDIGLDAQLNNMLTLFTDYSFQAGQSNYFGQSVQAGAKIGF